MITWGDLYTVLSAVVPLYVAMILAYGSVKWWSIFTRDQCAGINRFVAVFAVPLLSFQFISGNNIYAMNYRFIAADSLQKVVILVVLGLWAKLGKSGSLDWMITLFSLSTLPNTLVMGIPLLKAMYGGESGSLMVQVVVMQSVIWYTLMLFLFEFRGAKMLIMEQFPAHGHDIVSFRVDSDVVSLDGRDPLQADAEVGDDGKIHVTVRKSTSSRSVRSRSAGGLASLPSLTPRPSNMTGVEIYSLQSSRNPTPRGSSFNHTDFYSMVNKNLSPLHSNFQPPEIYSRGVTPRTSNYEDDSNKAQRWPGAVQKHLGRSISGGLSAPDAAVPYPVPNTGMGMLSPTHNNNNNHMVALKKSGSHGVEGMARSPHGHYQQQPQRPGDGKELHMFVWSSSASPVSEANHMFGVNHDLKDARPIHPTDNSSKGYHESSASYDEFSHIKKGSDDYGGGREVEMASPVNSKLGQAEYRKDGSVIAIQEQASSMPPASVMTRLILIMVWRKLIRNPNTYSSALGLIWSLVSFRFNIEMPKIIHGSISILSDAGLGMAMVSLGLFMALQPKIIACGKSVAAFAMAVRFLTGPAVMAASSIVIGLRGPLLHLAIVQAALPQGIVPFVFAKEYNVHPEILSTAVIFGMLIALPITLLYYIFLGL